MSQLQLKVLCCNIRVDVPADSESGNGWNDRKAFCLEVMQAQKADLICVQEAQNAHYTDLRTGLTGYDSFGLQNPALGFAPCNAMFYDRSRFNMISAGGFWLSEQPHVAGSISWDSARPRFANWVQLKDTASGREFRLWNLHLDHIGQVARENQARVLVEGSQVFGDDLPQLLTGDFNCDASNPALNTIKSGGWVDTYTALHGDEEPGITYHAFVGMKFADARPPEKFVGKMDFIFCRGPVRPLKAEILRDNRDGKYPSDHFFISAEVALQ